MPSRIRDVAARAGVSSATVSRVLSNKPHVRAEVRERVQEAVAALGYRPNRIARSLRVQRSRFIGLMVSDIQNPFFSTVMRAVEDVALTNGFGVFLCNSDENPEREQLYLDLFLDEQVAGIILTPTRAGAEPYRNFTDVGIPLAVIDRQIVDLELDTVVTDNRASAERAVGTLLAGGHRRIGAILSELSITTGQERFAGYRAALAAAGLPFDPACVRFGKPVEAEGYGLAQELMRASAPPTALFTGSKLLTLGVMRYLCGAGLRIPQDVALASFDALDWLPTAPQMVVVEQPAYEIGACAAQLLFKRMADPERPVERVVLASSVRPVG